MPCRHLHGEEIRGDQNVPVELEELCPAHARLASLRCWIHLMTAQHVAHRDFVDAMPQVRQGALDAAVPPRRVLVRHAHDELFDFLGDTRASKRFALLAAIELVGNQSLVPTQESIGRGEGGERFEALTAQWIRQCGETAAFGRVPEPCG